MARYTGADCRKCRRAKQKLFLKGSKCDSAKCPFEARPYPPGQHGRGRSKDSEYLLQLREKQKAKQIYGIFERQFRGYYEEANQKKGKTGDNLLRILESRLDNVVYRAGFAKSRDMGRQLVRHGHIHGQRQQGRRPLIPRVRHRHRRSSAQLGRADAVRRRARRGRRARGAGMARGHPLADAHPGSHVAGSAADRLSAARAADRRALLQVAARHSRARQPLSTASARTRSRRQIVGVLTRR